MGGAVLCCGVLWLSTVLSEILWEKIFSMPSVCMCVGLGRGRVEVRGRGIAGPKNKELEKLHKTLNSPLRARGNPQEHGLELLEASHVGLRVL